MTEAETKHRSKSSSLFQHAYSTWLPQDSALAGCGTWKTTPGIAAVPCKAAVVDGAYSTPSWAGPIPLPMGLSYRIISIGWQ